MNTVKNVQKYYKNQILYYKPGSTGGALFPTVTGSSQWPRKWLRQGIFFSHLFLQKIHWRMKNVHINVRPHILLPKVVSVKNSHFSTENANVVT